MLKRRPAPARTSRTAQQGVVLLVALIVLVAITVAGIAMMRSVDTATLVTGNLAFEEVATHAADQGVEAAMTMLAGKRTDATLDSNDVAAGYSATLRSTDSPATGQSWQEFWDANLAAVAVKLPDEPFGNKIYYVVHRECANAQPPGAGGQCVASPAVTKASGNSEEAGEIELQSASQVYYRITVRVSGPRRTESYVQTHIAM
jgi:Tfp pilus assembly protein PilX